MTGFSVRFMNRGDAAAGLLIAGSVSPAPVSGAFRGVALFSVV
jgi:hypothetical protein